MALLTKTFKASRRSSSVQLSKAVRSALTWFFLLLIGAIMLFPVAYTVLGAFKSNQELTSGGTLWPQQWRFENFREAWEIANFGKYIWNTLFLCFWAVLGALFTATMTAYCINRRNFPGRRVLIISYTALMFISIGPLTLRPLYEFFISLNMQNSLWPVVFILIGGQAVNIFILNSYMKSIPRELDEAAALDGAGFFRIYWQIVLPLCKPALGVVALFEFRQAWNEYLYPLVFTLTNPDLRPLSVGVAALRYNDTAATQWNLMLTGAAISIVPMLIVYAFTNRSFISGLSSGALKG